MLLSGVGFTVYLVLAKLMSADVHPLFLAFFRSFFGLVVTLPLVAHRGLAFFQTPKLGLIVTRSLFGTAGFMLSLLAVSDFFNLPLAQFNALSFTRPLFVTILAATLLAEVVGIHRWGAVAVGFLGVLVMVMPGTVFFWLPHETPSQMDLGAVLAILSAFGFAGAIVLVKSLSGIHTPMQLLVWANLLSSVLLLPFAIWYWSDPGLEGWLLIGLMGLAGVGAQFCYITAMSIGDASFLSPMDYLRLPMAAVADVFMIQRLPGPYLWLGAGIIVAAALYITIREARRGRPRREGP